jgi:hypothetical protein
MYGENVRVYGEDLNVGPVLVGGTMGAITVNVFAAGDVTVSSGKVTVTAADTADGSFATAAEGTLANGSYKKGELIGTVTLPADVKMFAKATLSGVSGDAVVKTGYLPR